jgi:hypothetical protein
MAVLLPITKSRESTCSRRAFGECDTALKSSWRGLQVWFRPCPDRRLGREAMMSQSPGSPKSRQFRDSTLGILGKSVIRMQARRRGTENTIGRMVVTPPESGLWWVLCVKKPVACPNTQGCSWMWTNPFVVGFGCRFKLDNLVPLPSLIPGLLARPSTPLKCWKSGAAPKSQLFATLHGWTLKWVQQRT